MPYFDGTSNWAVDPTYKEILERTKESKMQILKTELKKERETGGTVVYGNEETLKSVYIPKTLIKKPYPDKVTLTIEVEG